MFDIAPTEFLLVAVIALVVIGPKDLPKAMRVAGYWVGKARGVARQFRQGFDNMVREAELEEMEKRWKAENQRIMREHPAEPAADPDAPIVDVENEEPGEEDEAARTALHAERPEIMPAEPDKPSSKPDGFAS